MTRSWARTQRRSTVAIAAALLILAAAQGAAARCGDEPGDDAAVAAARAAVAVTCPCATATSRAAYLECARGVAIERVGQGTLPASCRADVVRCASRSTCGRPGAVTCCRTNAQGKTRCSIARDAARCRPQRGGQACVGAFPSCCDACTATGCAPVPTPTPSPTPARTPTPGRTPTPPAQPIPTLPPLPELCEPLIGLPPLAQVPFTVVQGTTNCGTPGFDPPASPPFSGRVNAADGTKLADLGEGCLYAGSLPPLAIPDGSTAMLDVVGLNLLPLEVKLGGSPGNGPLDCTLGAGPDAHCLNGAPGTDGAGACTSDAHCGGPGSCHYDGNCFFGPPIPVPFGATSACVVNTFLTDLCGEVNLLSRDATLATTISARVYLTGDVASPCPRCVAGVCTAGENAGGSCVAVGSAGTSPDCPPADASFLASLTVGIPALTTNQATAVADGSGDFCAGQPGEGAFGLPTARSYVETGAGLLESGSLLGMRLAGTFCIPPTGGFLDAIAGLPAPGAISQRGELDLSQLLLP
jgi:hypothetical protein